MFSRRKRVALLFAALLSAGDAGAEDMVEIPAGSYLPLFKTESSADGVDVAGFAIDRYPVTNREFAAFVERNPRWRRDRVKRLFADSNYLAQFGTGDEEAIANRPVTRVSWFAARAYCRDLDKRLPTTSEWERVAQASANAEFGTRDAAYRRKILDWYARPATDELPEVGQTEANYWGVHGLHGVVWELVEDFNNALVTGESRGDSQLEKQLFCGAGAAASVDPGDYAAFMRYALRSSYQANYTMQSLGFRCARSAD